MTHFLTQKDLLAFLPWLLLLGRVWFPRVPKTAISLASLVALGLTWPHTPEEMFSRQLAHDAWAAALLMGTLAASHVWRLDAAETFALALMGACADVMCVWVVAAIAASRARSLDAPLALAAALVILYSGTLVATNGVTDVGTLLSLCSVLGLSAGFVVAAAALVYARASAACFGLWAVLAARCASWIVAHQYVSGWVLR